MQKPSDEEKTITPLEQEDSSNDNAISEEKSGVRKKKTKDEPKKYRVKIPKTSKERGVIYRIIYLLFICGDLPKTCITLTESYQTYVRKLQVMMNEATYINSKTKETITGVLVKEVGEGRDKLLRLTATGKKMLRWFGWEEEYPLLNPYTARTREQQDRARRVAEILVVNDTAGFEYRYDRPERRKGKPILYSVKRLNEITDGTLTRYDVDIGNKSNGNPIPRKDNKKTIYTRVCGAVIGDGMFYAVYNTRGKLMKWAGNTESQARSNFNDYAVKLAGVQKMEKAILFANSYEIGMRLLESSDALISNSRQDKNKNEFADIYFYVYCVPLNQFGIKQYQFLLSYQYHLNRKDIFFKRSEQTVGKESVDCDAFSEGANQFLFFDGDIARLKRLKQFQSTSIHKLVIWCFPEQVPFVQKYMSGEWELEKQKRLDAIEEKRKRNYDKAMEKKRAKSGRKKQESSKSKEMTEEELDMCEWMDDMSILGMSVRPETKSDTKPAPIIMDYHIEIRTVTTEQLNDLIVKIVRKKQQIKN